MAFEVIEIKSFIFPGEAEIAKFTSAKTRNYKDSLKAYRDLKNFIDTARKEVEMKD